MARDKVDETDEGFYEASGDILEWRWKAGKEPVTEVPEGEFDPRDPVARPKAAPAATKAASK